MKVVELNAEEFAKLVKELDECREDKKKLEEANKFLNEQIKQYNEKFAKDKSEN